VASVFEFRGVLINLIENINLARMNSLAYLRQNLGDIQFFNLQDIRMTTGGRNERKSWPYNTASVNTETGSVSK
jgi:hypothetical protein